MAKGPPPRLLWAVERLPVEPDDHLLEIGCGPGVAVSLICDRLDDGTITAIDRSPVMVNRALKRNEQHVASGKATIQLGELEELDLPEGSFTKIFAVNVNLFWVRSPATELEIIRRLATPDGALYLFYEPPSDGKAYAIAEQLSTALTGSSIETTLTGSKPLIAAVARL